MTADTSIADNTYDVIYSRDELLHIPHEAKPAMYKKFYKWLKPGGVLAVGDYCIGAASAKAMAPNFQKYLDERGYHLHSIDEWKDVLTTAGFDDSQINVEDRGLWYCQTCQREMDQVAIPGSPGHTKVLALFDQAKLDGLVGSYRDKISMTLREDRLYAIVTAYKKLTHYHLRQQVCQAYKIMSDRG